MTIKNILNTILNISENIISDIFTKIFSSFLSVYWQLRGFEIGANISFFGFTYFKRGKNNIVKIGNNCKFRSNYNSNLIGINHPCIISSIGEESKLIIGNNCGFSGTVIGCFKYIEIGQNVRFGANTLVTDSDWHLADIRVGPPSPIIIKDNVWIGYNAVILKGVTIGENSIIGAGSIVSKDVPPNVIAAGNPCKVIKNL
jgi:acetyltransferase-like isoleucine patch superfamily enzyme